MASDSEPEGGAAELRKSARPPSSTGERPKKKKLKRPRLPVPETEEQVDSPTKMTVGMLGILGLMTIIMWALARGGCNYHPPKETRVPRKVTTEELAHDPKNAAIELQQRLLTRDYAGALELATGDAAQAIEQAKAACDAACLATRKALAASVLTSATIVDVNPLGATARVTSVGLPDGPKTYLMRLERVDPIWKASQLKPDTGVPLPEPVALPGTALTAASAAPSASAASRTPLTKTLHAPHAALPPPAPTTSH